MPIFHFFTHLVRFALIVLLMAGLALVPEAAPAAEAPPAVPDLPELQQPGPLYRTPRAGEGFRTEAFGREVQVLPRDRSSTAAWDVSIAAYRPKPDGLGFQPIGVLTFWDHDKEGSLLRAQVSGLYDDIFWSRPLANGTEGVLTFENLTIPVPQAELVDGLSVDREELLWGYVRPGFGLGLRRNIAPGHSENMAALDLFLEPGYMYFRPGTDTAPGFVVPRNTFLGRVHLQMRLDGLDRNLLELPHDGVAAGFDLVLGHRFTWGNWGPAGAIAASSGRNYTSLTAYFLTAGAVPGIESERHRLVGALYAGAGQHLDRFSAPRIGGGPNPLGEEYGTTADPILPGATMQEFFPRHYMVLTVEYRWEPVFFAFIGINGSVATLDRLRDTPAGFVSDTDSFRSIGTRVTSGFLFQSRLQVAYNYNFDVVRNGEFGGHEVVLSVARSF